MKNIVLIQSHCDTEEKLDYLKKNIEKIKKFDLEILLFSHIPLNQEVIGMVDYFVFDKSNPILWDERRHYFWWVDNGYKLETTIPDYGWTVFNQIKKSCNLIQSENYNFVYAMCYDLVIDETIEKFLLDPQMAIFKHSKVQKDETQQVEFKTGLVFFVLKFEDLKNLMNNINKKNYSDNWELIAEAYFEVKLKSVGIDLNSELVVYDKFHQTNDIFDLLQNPNFEIFVDNTNLLKFRISKKRECEISIIVNDEYIKLSTPIMFYDRTIEKIKTFGVLIEHEYINLIPLLLEKKINKMTFLN